MSYHLGSSFCVKTAFERRSKVCTSLCGDIKSALGLQEIFTFTKYPFVSFLAFNDTIILRHLDEPCDLAIAVLSLIRRKYIRPPEPCDFRAASSSSAMSQALHHGDR